MGKKAYVFSTLATDVKYVDWLPAPDAGGMAVEGRGILIRGGTGVMNDRLVTPLGVSTEIDEDDIPLLERNSLFKLHKENGHVQIQTKSADPEVVAADMNIADPSSPKTPSDFEGAGEKRAKPASKNR